MIFPFILLYTPFLYCNEIYIRVSRSPTKYLTGIMGKNVHTTEDISKADTFTFTENLNNRGWYHINVVGKNLVFSMSSRGYNYRTIGTKTLVYNALTHKTPKEEGFFFILLPNFEYALLNNDGKCFEFKPEKDIFKIEKCNYVKNINYRFQIIKKEDLSNVTKDVKNLGPVGIVAPNTVAITDKDKKETTPSKEINQPLTNTEEKNTATDKVPSRANKETDLKNMTAADVINQEQHRHHNPYHCNGLRKSSN